MATYLLNWNPKRFDWFELPDEIEELRAWGSLEGTWSCGVTKRILPGDRFYLMRLGVPPKGIVGSGWITRGSYEGLHWDEQLADEDRRALFVDVCFDARLGAEHELILDLDVLQTDPILGQMNCLAQGSGIHIPDHIADELQRHWSMCLTLELPTIEAPDLGFVEGFARESQTTYYERSLAARQFCLNHYGPQCVICGFDFEKTYGAAGAGFIHIHHIVPLSAIGEEYVVDPITDMVPVCPNCHAIIHRRTPCYSIEEVRAFWQKAHKSATS